MPRRSAPRNDSGGDVTAPQCPAPADTWHVFAHLARQTFLHPQTRYRLQHVIANQCAHWCGNPFSPQRSLASGLLFGQIRDALRMRPKCCYFAMPHRRRSGLSRRSAPRNDMQKHAACQQLHGPGAGQIRWRLRFRTKHCFPLYPTARRKDCPIAVPGHPSLHIPQRQKRAAQGEIGKVATFSRENNG